MLSDIEKLWYQVLIIKPEIGEKQSAEQIRMGTCRITHDSSLKKFIFKAQTTKYKTKECSSTWTSRVVWCQDNNLIIYYDYYSRLNQTFKRGIIDLNFNELEKTLDGEFWDLAPSNNWGIIKLFDEEEKAISYINELFTEKPSIPNSLVNVFVSYSHKDKEHLHSLCEFLSGLERDNFTFWHDEGLKTSEDWDKEIKDRLNSADIALVLVSQSFLNSQYCINIEIETFIKERLSRGLVIYPIILSACDWKNYHWLSSIKFQPQDGKTIEKDYRERGVRDELYLSILEEIRSIGNKIKRGK